MPIVLDDEYYVLVHLSSEKCWNQLFDLCKSCLNLDDEKNHKSDATKIREYLQNVAKSVLVERNYHDKDYRDTYYNYYSKKFAVYPSRCLRLNFFDVEIPPNELFDLSSFNKNYIGYIIIRPTRVRTIGRTVLNPGKIDFIKGFIPTSTYKTHLLGTPMEIDGFPYISQDSDVTICAHAACWMVFRHFSERYSLYGEKGPYQITQMTHDISQGRLVPSKGLTIGQVTEIFSEFGFYPLVYFLEQFEEKDKSLGADKFKRLLYYYVESGLPVVAGLSSKEHAITVIGHLPPRKKKVGEKIKSTAETIPGYIINDDNHMPYQALWDRNSVPNVHSSDYRVKHIDRFVVPMYEKIYLSAEYIEDLVAEYLDPKAKFQPENFGVPLNDLATRIFLTSSRSYKRFRVDHPIPNGVDWIYRQMPMPKFIWVAELSTNTLFSKNKIIGEILIDATASPRDPLAFLSIHFPKRLFINNRDSDDGNSGEDYNLQIGRASCRERV